VPASLPLLLLLLLLAIFGSLPPGRRYGGEEEKNRGYRLEVKKNHTITVQVNDM
jgi:hypothetical protein